ncbi:MAG: type III secretion system chaperone [Planctomycetaceae bacterium]
MRILIALGLSFACLTCGRLSAQEAAALPPGAVSEKTLGEMLNAIGLKPLKTDKRYDFAFKTSIHGEEWKFSMSAVLSRNSESVWVMAWLDQIPDQSAQVPRTALLRLLAANDRLGNGKFFAYIPANKRFVLQRVIENEQMSTKKLTEALQDLAVSVAEEHPIWSVANWAPTGSDPHIAAGKSDTVPVPPTSANHQPQIRTSESQSKFGERSVQ